MIGSFVALVVVPLAMAGLARWAAARRRHGLAAGRAVHFRCRLDGRKGRLLADPRLDGPVFLDRSGGATALPRGGEALDATVTTTGQAAFEKVGLRYRTPDGQVLRLGLGTHDARTIGAWLSEQAHPTLAPAHAAAVSRPLPTPHSRAPNCATSPRATSDRSGDASAASAKALDQAILTMVPAPSSAVTSSGVPWCP